MPSAITVCHDGVFMLFHQATQSCKSRFSPHLVGFEAQREALFGRRARCTFTWRNKGSPCRSITRAVHTRLGAALVALGGLGAPSPPSLSRCGSPLGRDAGPCHPCLPVTVTKVPSVPSAPALLWVLEQGGSAESSAPPWVGGWSVPSRGTC